MTAAVLITLSVIVACLTYLGWESWRNREIEPAPPSERRPSTWEQHAFAYPLAARAFGFAAWESLGEVGCDDPGEHARRGCGACQIKIAYFASLVQRCNWDRAFEVEIGGAA